MEDVKNDSNLYPSFSPAFFYRLSRFCQATESHSRTHAPPSPLPNKSTSFASYIHSINSSQQGRLISKQNIIPQLAAVQHKLFRGCYFSVISLCSHASLNNRKNNIRTRGPEPKMIRLSRH